MSDISNDLNKENFMEISDTFSRDLETIKYNSRRRFGSILIAIGVIALLSRTSSCNTTYKKEKPQYEHITQERFLARCYFKKNYH